MAYVAPTVRSVGDAVTAADYNIMANDVISFRNNSGVVPPAVRLERGTAQSISNTTDTLVTWPTEVFDTDGMYTATSDTITVVTAGIYQINVTVEFAVNATGIRVVSLLKNPSSASDQSSRIASTAVSATSVAGGNCVLSCSTIISLVATNTIKVQVYQSSGGALNVGSTGAALQTNISMAMLGATA